MQKTNVFGNKSAAKTLTRGERTLTEIINPTHRIFVTYGAYAVTIIPYTHEVREMRKLPIAIASVVAVLAISVNAPVFAQDAVSFGTETAAPQPKKMSMFQSAMSEVAIMRYRAALKLKAEQAKYWPAVANALRALAREPQVNEAAVRRFQPAASALFASLDEDQKRTAMSLVQRAGLQQYAAMF